MPLSPLLHIPTYIVALLFWGLVVMLIVSHWHEREPMFWGWIMPRLLLALAYTYFTFVEVEVEHRVVIVRLSLTLLGISELTFLLIRKRWGPSQ